MTGRTSGGQQPRNPQASADARRFATEAARLAANTRCHNVVVLDVRGLSPVTDYMVLATGTSPRQMKTVADQLEEIGRPANHRPYSRADDDTSHWTVIDFIDVVCHLFDQDARMYYDLDNLWGDAKRVDWEAEAGPAQAAAEPQPRSVIIREN